MSKYDFSHLYQTETLNVLDDPLDPKSATVFSVVIGKIPHGVKADSQKAMFSKMDIELDGTDKTQIDSALAQGMASALKNGGFDPAAKTDMEAIAAIVSWNLKTSDGLDAPIDLEVWRAMPDIWTEQIEAAVERINPELDSEFQNKSGSGGKS